MTRPPTNGGRVFFTARKSQIESLRKDKLLIVRPPEPRFGLSGSDLPGRLNSGIEQLIDLWTYCLLSICQRGWLAG